MSNMAYDRDMLNVAASKKIRSLSSSQPSSLTSAPIYANLIICKLLTRFPPLRHFILFLFILGAGMADNITLFQEAQPSLESYWRSVILFGRNVASYKFALAKSLLEIAPTGRTDITLFYKLISPTYPLKKVGSGRLSFSSGGQATCDHSLAAFVYAKLKGCPNSFLFQFSGTVRSIPEIFINIIRIYIFFIIDIFHINTFF